MGFDIARPDFSLVDPEALGHPTTQKTHHSNHAPQWRYQQGFVEVKQGPRADCANTVVDIVQQSADYARLHMAARPFQLFSVGLLIFGMRFCVAIHDRDGVTFSPQEDLNTNKGLELFIRIVRRMACDMTPIELGQDPTAQVFAPDHPATIELRDNALVHRLDASAKFPTYSVSFGGHHQRHWGTVSMVWSSVSLLGRGTTVWIVRELINDKPTGDLKILKTAWRHRDRTPESEVYKALDNGSGHPAVAKFDTGADVCFPNSDGQKICVSRLRGAPATDDDPTLHRLILSSVGRPIWEYNTGEELLRGLKAAVLGRVS